MSSSSTDPVSSSGPVAIRWRLLDALRGFALLGVLLVNSLDITGVGEKAPEAAGHDVLREVLYLGVQTRFVPIFAFLFGMSLWFVLQGARVRGGRPGVVVLRRLVVLAGVGWVLALVYPGNILIEYGIYGLPVLLVAVLLPGRVVLVLGVGLTVATYAIFFGGEPTTPGLIMAGTGAAAAGLPRVLERAGRATAAVFLLALAAAVPFLASQLQAPGDPRFTVGGVAGVVLAVGYVAGFALLWRTRARRLLSAVFTPLGRMALSNYVGAAVIFAVAARLVDFSSSPSIAPVVVASLLVIAVQSVVSRLWLHRFRYGPFEWLWRMGTWWRWVPLVRRPHRLSPIEPSGGRVILENDPMGGRSPAR